ncbi:MAG: right-handed parallel beta-helix repeat-containing protein [Armatimonadota bacterium]
MNKRITIAIILILFVTANLSAQVETLNFYVSTNGNDNWSGTLETPNPAKSDGPFKSITKARDTIRNLKQSNKISKPINVIIDDGIYYLTEPIVFTEKDSGTKDYPITYKAKNKHKAIISGGIPLDKSKWEHHEGNIYKYKFDKFPKNANPKILRVGEEWAIRARHPNMNIHSDYKGSKWDVKARHPQYNKNAEKEWLFAKYDGNPWEYGQFNYSIGHLGDPKCEIFWNLKNEKADIYKVWLRYKHNSPQDMGGTTQISVNQKDYVTLNNIPNTNSEYKWTPAAEIYIPSGNIELHWKKTSSQGWFWYNIDAIIFTNDFDFIPSEKSFNYEAKTGKNLIIVQGEAFTKINNSGKEQKPAFEAEGRDYLAFNKNDIPQINDWYNVELNIFNGYGWFNAIIPITNIDYNNNIISLGHKLESESRLIRAGNRYFLENSYALLDADNEWFFNKPNNTLYYIPENNIINDEVVVSVLDELIVFKGSSEKGNYIENIIVDGLQFIDTSYNIVTHYLNAEDAAIKISSSKNCQISNCLFNWIGGYAIELNKLSNSNKIIANEIKHVGQGGINIFEDKYYPYSNLISGNLIHDIGLIYKHVAGVYIHCGEKNIVSHNTMQNLPRYGVGIKSWENLISKNNIIEYNEVIDSSLETHDTGAIEMYCGRVDDRVMVSNIIRYNKVVNTHSIVTDQNGKFKYPSMAWGIYLDANSHGNTVFGNVVANTYHGALNINDGKHNIIDNNIFVNGTISQVWLATLAYPERKTSENTFTRNIIYYSNPNSKLFQIRLFDKSKGISHSNKNLFWSTATNLNIANNITPVGSFKDWQNAGFDKDSIIADPLFVDIENNNFNLKPVSPAWKLGFKPIPFEKIGVAGFVKEDYK